MLITTDNQPLDLQELVWQEARPLLLSLVPDLVAIIDQLSPDADFKLYKARYPFGARVIDKTHFYLPLSNGEVIDLNDQRLPTRVAENLQYGSAASNPVGLVLDKHSEFYLTANNRIMPYAMATPGGIFGLSRVLDHAEGKPLHHTFFRWEMNSGARSLFMLPKITENISHNRLNKRYNLSLLKPEGYETHWNVFKALVDQEKNSWRSEFLFFSKQWFAHLQDPKWSEFYNYCLCKNRSSHAYWRNILSWQITFNAIEQTRNLRFSPYLLNTAKHLFAIAGGSLPGFKPATDEAAAPIAFLQEAYVEGYGLSEYWPILMQLGHFCLDTPTLSAPVYYSLNYPTLAESDPDALKGKTLITLLDELQLIMEKYQKGIETEALAQASSLYEVVQSTEFSYYHNDPSHFQRIKDNILLPTEDPRFIVPDAQGEFPRHSPFLKGCIKIAAKSV